MPKSIELVPLLWVLWAWLAFSVLYVAIGIARRQVNEPVPDSPFESERSAHARYLELRAHRFNAGTLAYMALANGAGGVLAYYALAGQIWAGALFALAGAWLIYDHASTPFALRGLHPRLAGELDWVYFASGTLVWLYALACIVFRLLGAR